MSHVNMLLGERLKRNEKSSKMTVMADRSASGNLTGFSGIFSPSEPTEEEKKAVEDILLRYETGKGDIKRDLSLLISITSEVTAINNQAVILHGERIKKAHTILTSYREGAFTAWLITAYGNRQTPYNFMQYYLFCEAMPKALRTQIESMPRQAVYTLATREGDLDKKRNIVEAYKGQTKGELLKIIRKAFPLEEADRRQKDPGQEVIDMLKRLSDFLKENVGKISKSRKPAISALLDDIRSRLQ